SRLDSGASTPDRIPCRKRSRIARTSIVTTPVLSTLGWSAMGPRAASIAAALQTASTPARGVFATLQSAAMGGYGASVVAGATRLVVGVATFIRAATPKPRQEREKDTQREDSGRDDDEDTFYRAAKR
ncbi:uncharacterized protein BDZ99DRAFT_562970, partial [Mytilinidion resinicola]